MCDIAQVYTKVSCYRFLSDFGIFRNHFCSFILRRSNTSFMTIKLCRVTRVNVYSLICIKVHSNEYFPKADDVHGAYILVATYTQAALRVCKAQYIVFLSFVTHYML